jgi:hypothetical protein
MDGGFVTTVGATGRTDAEKKGDKRKLEAMKRWGAVAAVATLLSISVNVLSAGGLSWKGWFGERAQPVCWTCPDRRFAKVATIKPSQAAGCCVQAASPWQLRQSACVELAHTAARRRACGVASTQCRRWLPGARWPAGSYTPSTA